MPSELKYRILVVEDEIATAEMLQEMLRRLGCSDILRASSGEEAITIAEEERPDIVLMDIQLGNQNEPDGIDAGNVIRRLYETPVILITGQAGDDVLERAKLMGASGYVVKPVPTSEIIRVTIEMALFNFQRLEATDSEIRISIDCRRSLLGMNARGRQLLAVTEGCLLNGRLIDDLLAETFLKPLKQAITDASVALRRGSFEIQVKAKDNTMHHLDINVIPIDFCGHLVGFVLAGHDVTLHKVAEKRIEASLREKEVLLREVHHRVRNQLATISALLRGITGKVTDGTVPLKGVEELLKDSRQRLDTMALLHEELYQSEDQASVKVHSYIQRIVSTIKGSMKCETVTFQLRAEEMRIKLQVASPLGLIINEIVMNSIKHAFLSHGKGIIAITFTQIVGNQLQLVIQDDGSGFDEKLATRVSGLALIRGLVTQLHGQCTISAAQGTTYTVTFPA